LLNFLFIFFCGCGVGVDTACEFLGVSSEDGEEFAVVVVVGGKGGAVLGTGGINGINPCPVNTFDEFPSASRTDPAVATVTASVSDFSSFSSRYDEDDSVVIVPNSVPAPLRLGERDALFLGACALITIPFPPIIPLPPVETEPSVVPLALPSKALANAKLPIPEFLPFHGSIPHDPGISPNVSSCDAPDAPTILKFGSRFRKRVRTVNESDLVREEREREKDEEDVGGVGDDGERGRRGCGRG